MGEPDGWVLEILLINFGVDGWWSMVMDVDGVEWGGMMGIGWLNFELSNLRILDLTGMGWLSDHFCLPIFDA